MRLLTFYFRLVFLGYGFIPNASLPAKETPTLVRSDQVLLRAGEGGYFGYTIPAAVATRSGHVVLLLEGRKGSNSDFAPIDLLCLRSSDGGRTWGQLQVVGTEGRPEDSISIGNACPVYDRDTGRLWCLFNRENQEVFVTYSDNDGETWARPREITREVRPIRWTRYWTGPGHGLQLHTGPARGRLIMPSNHVTNESADGGHTYQMNLRSHMVYSDDHGQTWKIGASTQLAPTFDLRRARFAGGKWLPGEGGTWHGSECMAVQRADGRLFLILRNEAHYDNRKAVAWSSDGGETWTPVKLQAQLPDTRCQASIIRWTDPHAAQREFFLYTGVTVDDRPIRQTLDEVANPASGAKPPTGRQRLALFVSADGCENWREVGIVQPGPASYSDLVVLPDGEVLCFYEGGQKSAYEGIRMSRLDPAAWSQ